MSRDALVVGISQYQYLKGLKAPALDAEAIAQRLEKNGDFRVVRLPEKIITNGENLKKPEVSTTQAVSREKLEAALEQLFLPESNQAPETALFYFSGHGLPDESKVKRDKGYLAVSETDPKNPTTTSLSLDWLQCLLSDSPVKQQIIWLDCCHSGVLIVNVGAANPENGKSRDRCFIASSRDFESSWSDLNSSYSVFTKVLLDGLDPSRLPGRWINTLELAAYVDQRLQGERQTPVCANSGEGINLTRSWQGERQKTKNAYTDRNIHRSTDTRSGSRQMQEKNQKQNRQSKNKKNIFNVFLPLSISALSIIIFLFLHKNDTPKIIASIDSHKSGDFIIRRPTVTVTLQNIPSNKNVLFFVNKLHPFKPYWLDCLVNKNDQNPNSFEVQDVTIGEEDQINTTFKIGLVLVSNKVYQDLCIDQINVREKRNLQDLPGDLLVEQSVIRK